MGNKLINFRASDRLRTRIADYATEKDLNISEACRNLIVQQLEQQEQRSNANHFAQFLASLGYSSVSEIPNEELDAVVGAYLDTKKEVV